MAVSEILSPNFVSEVPGQSGPQSPRTAIMRIADCGTGCFDKPLHGPYDSADMGRKAKDQPINSLTALSPYKAFEWTALTPRERLRRSWKMRSRIKNLREIH